MRIKRIRKRNGGVRVLYCVDNSERYYYRNLLTGIPSCHDSHIHGFVPGRNIVTNALPHVGQKVVVSFDLSDFFDSCTMEKARGLFSKEVLKSCFLSPSGTEKHLWDPQPDSHYAARQGLPTSPAIANRIFETVDRAIVKKLSKLQKEEGVNIVYTRYADDLTVSLSENNRDLIKKIISSINEIVSRSGFKLNPKKTRVQKSERKEVCGVMVGKDGIYPSRYCRRLLRAMEHRYALMEEEDYRKVRLALKIAGLKEFMRLKIPRIKTENEIKDENRLKEAYKICQTYPFLTKLSRDLKIVEKAIPEREIAPNIYITNDPVYFLGMSTYTTSWRTCMSLDSDYSYKKGTIFLYSVEGVSLAVMLSNRMKDVAGVRRRVMIARCILYALRDGRICYGKVYGNNTNSLTAALEKEGILPAWKCSGKLVIGNAPCKKGRFPYFDNCIPEKVTLVTTGRTVYRLRMK